jgi:conjugative relaxase-like TrwC/TraI family protein
VLSLKTLTAGHTAYYERQLQDGLDDYYVDRQEAGGEWMGAGAALLGLDGEVTSDQFRELLARPTKVVAIDLTFSAPKSVSVLAVAGGERVADELQRSHRDAVREAIAHLDRAAVKVRRGHAGARLLDGDGLVVAAFTDRMSRAQDPQLHTHCVAANTTRGPDGRWTALDSRSLFHAAHDAGYLYQARLRELVVERLGLAWGEVRKGAAELVCVPDEVRMEFSRRRREMEASGMNLDTFKSSEAAARATRSRKQYGVDTESWRQEVRARAAEHGLDHRTLEQIDRGVTYWDRHPFWRTEKPAARDVDREVAPSKPRDRYELDTPGLPARVGRHHDRGRERDPDPLGLRVDRGDHGYER